MMNDPIQVGLEEARNNILEGFQKFKLIAAQQRLLSNKEKIFLLFSGLEIFIYIAFVLLFTAVTFLSRDPTAFYYSSAVQHATVLEVMGPDFSHVAKNYFDIGNFNDLWNWLESAFPQHLLPIEWYNGDPFTANEKHFVHGVMRIVGLIRFRQARVRQNSCDINSVFKGVIPHCYYQYNPYTESRDCFGSNCSYAYEAATRAAVTKYFWGKLYVFGEGGFTEDIEPTLPSYKTKLAALKQNRWLDRNSRALFIDFTLYNANVNMFSVVTLSMEFPSSGGVVPSAVFRTVRLYRYTKFQDYVLLGFELIILVFLLYFLVRLPFEVVIYKWQAFQNIWNYIDACNLAIFAIVIYLRLSSVVQAATLKFDPETSHYADFQGVAQTIQNEQNFNSLNALLIWMKIFKHTRILQRFNQLARVLSKAAVNLLLFSVMAAIVFFGFAQAFYIAFGTDIKAFRDIVHSSFSLTTMLFGSFNFTELNDANRVLGPFLFLSFQSLMLFVLLNMFFSIIDSKYGIVIEEDKELKKKGVLSFLLDFGHADSNHDHVISEDEIRQVVEKEVEKLDIETNEANILVDSLVHQSGQALQENGDSIVEISLQLPHIQTTGQRLTSVQTIAMLNQNKEKMAKITSQLQRLLAR